MPADPRRFRGRSSANIGGFLTMFANPGTGVAENPDFGKAPGDIDFNYTGDPSALANQRFLTTGYSFGQKLAGVPAQAAALNNQLLMNRAMEADKLAMLPKQLDIENASSLKHAQDVANLNQHLRDRDASQFATSSIEAGYSPKDLPFNWDATRIGHFLTDTQGNLPYFAGAANAAEARNTASAAETAAPMIPRLTLLKNALTSQNYINDTNKAYLDNDIFNATRLNQLKDAEINSGNSVLKSTLNTGELQGELKRMPDKQKFLTTQLDLENKALPFKAGLIPLTAPAYKDVTTGNNFENPYSALQQRLDATDAAQIETNARILRMLEASGKPVDPAMRALLTVPPRNNPIQAGDTTMPKRRGANGQTY